MTLKPEDRDRLIRHKFHRAYETCKEAKLLFDNHMFAASVNRIYYGIYYALSALAIKHGFQTSKHGQLIGWFNKNFVKENLIELKFARILTKSFEKRMDGDYEDFIEFTPEEVETMLNDMQEFITRLELFAKDQ